MDISANLNSILDYIKKTQLADLKIAGRKAKNLKTHIFKFTKIGKFKFDLMNMIKTYNTQLADTLLQSTSLQHKSDTLTKLSKDHFKEIDRIAGLKKKGKISAKRVKELSKAAETVYGKMVKEMGVKVNANIAKLKKMRSADRALINTITSLKEQMKLAKKSRNKKLIIGLGIGIVIASIIAISLKSFSGRMKKSRKKCYKIKDPRQKNVCEITAQIVALEDKAIILQKQAPQCEITSDPKKCNQKIENEIEKIENEIAALDNKLYNALKVE